MKIHLSPLFTYIFFGAIYIIYTGTIDADYYDRKAYPGYFSGFKHPGYEQFVDRNIYYLTEADIDGLSKHFYIGPGKYSGYYIYSRYLTLDTEMCVDLYSYTDGTIYTHNAKYKAHMYNRLEQIGDLYLFIWAIIISAIWVPKFVAISEMTAYMLSELGFVFPDRAGANKYVVLEMIMTCFKLLWLSLWR